MHCQTKTIEKALRNDCFLLFLPPNTSHFTQPLDNILFAGLKQKITRLSSDSFDSSLFWSNRHQELQEVVLEATLEAVPQIFTASHIKDAWKNVGNSPFNQDHLQNRAISNIGQNAMTPDPNSIRAEVTRVSKQVFQRMH